MCMPILVPITCVTGRVDRTVANGISGLQPMSANGTVCRGYPSGDPLEDLCGIRYDVSCCLYTAADSMCGTGLCLAVTGGNIAVLRTVLSHVPVDNITYLSLSNIDGWDLYAVPILPNLHTLSIWNLRTCLFAFSGMPHFRNIELYFTFVFLSPNNTFHGLNHLSHVTVSYCGFFPSSDRLIQLQAAKELTSLDITFNTALTKVDVWPLCLAQTHPGIIVRLDNNAIIDFSNTPSPSWCNIKTPLLENTFIDLSYNSITHVSDIATGWGFSSLHYFITSLMRDNCTDFPILQPVYVTAEILNFTEC